MRGFTLFECLIYLALFSLLMSGAFIGMVALSESADRNSAITLLEDEGPYLLAKIQGEVESGTIPALTLSGMRIIQTQDGISLPLSDSTLSVTSLVLKEVASGSPALRAITAAFSLSATSSSGAVISRDFSGTSYLSL